MPIVTIDLYQGFDVGYRKAILDGVHRALVDAFRIPEGDRNQILREHDQDHFERSEGKSEKFVLIEVKAYRGRTREAKRALYQNIVKNLGAAPGIPPNDILITIVEPELVNWGVAGGHCADEVDLGFKIDV